MDHVTSLGQAAFFAKYYQILLSVRAHCCSCADYALVTREIKLLGRPT